VDGLCGGHPRWRSAGEHPDHRQREQKDVEQMKFTGMSFENSASPEDNSHAGQGPVLLDIGDEVGALVVLMPPEMEGLEIEIRPAQDSGSTLGHSSDSGHPHKHGNDDRDGSDSRGSHSNGNSNSNSEHIHRHSDSAAPGTLLAHVAVLPRPAPSGIQYSAVFAELTQGEYELYVRPDGDVQLCVQVRGGRVEFARWPG
jgi:hypothetical protein